jgi:hypothetical protein
MGQSIGAMGQTIGSLVSSILPNLNINFVRRSAHGNTSRQTNVGRDTWSAQEAQRQVAEEQADHLLKETLKGAWQKQHDMRTNSKAYEHDSVPGRCVQRSLDEIDVDLEEHMKRMIARARWHTFEADRREAQFRAFCQKQSRLGGVSLLEFRPGRTRLANEWPFVQIRRAAYPRGGWRSPRVTRNLDQSTMIFVNGRRVRILLGRQAHGAREPSTWMGRGGASPSGVNQSAKRGDSEAADQPDLKRRRVERPDSPQPDRFDTLRRKGLHTASAQAASESPESKAIAGEVERILSARCAAEILGGGSRKDKRREFNRIVRLLHPDKGLVDPTDERAGRAYNLLINAWNSCNS